MRYVKMMRRLRGDRATHTDDMKKPPEDRCPCFLMEEESRNGRTRSWFADTPKLCSGYCCGNPRRFRGPADERYTMSERRSLLAERDEWDGEMSTA